MLYREEMAVEQIAFLTRSSVQLVEDYLALYEAALTVPHRREKLAEEVARVSQQALVSAEARGGMS